SLETGQREIASETDEVLDAVRISDAIPDLPATSDCQAVEGDALERLLGYYRRKRLGAQLKYFERRMHRKMAIANPKLASIFFFLGIALVLCSDIVEWIGYGAPGPRGEKTGKILLLLAFGVPMGWSAVRIIRGAFEFSRNSARSHARHSALAEVSASL